MECNRDEAIRARDIAEKKFAMQDFVGARKFLFKAQQLYPPLEGAPQMLAVLDVHIAAQTKVGTNETDWYGILQVEPISDDSTIKKQYRKLALLLHPDKNKAMGAEAAFKLIGEAFAVLSDKGKRYLHDSKRGAETKVPQMTSQVPEPPKPSYPAYQAQYQAAAQATAAPTPGAHAPHASLTFWTSCPLCRMQYQYLRTYLNYQLLCQKCHKPFLAKDINAQPQNGATPFSWPRGSFDGNNSFPGTGGPIPPAPKNAGFNFQAWSRNNGVASGSAPGNGHPFGPGDAHAAGVGNRAAGGSADPRGSAAAQAAAAANLVQEAYRRAQRERVEAERELKRKEREKEKLARMQEKEALRKARDEIKTKEAMEKLMRQRKEAIERAEKRKEPKKPRKRRRKDESDDEDEEEEFIERRRAAHQKRNGPSGLHGSDEDLNETFPGGKKFNMTGNGGDVFGSRIDKGKDVVYDDYDAEDEETWIDSGDGSSFANDRNGGSAFGAARVKDPLEYQLAERFRRELAAKIGIIPGRSFAQVSVAKPKEEHRPKAHNPSGAKSMGNSSAGNGKGDHKKETGAAAKAEADSASSPGAVEEAIVVPDPDFHDFDADRTEFHVKKNQVWAVFDGTDGMPRFYCHVTKVTRAPFSVEGIWLEPVHPEKDSFHWLNKRDLSISTGEFKYGEETEFDQINTFSHLMPIRRLKNAWEVYPKRAEVWAVYRDYDKDVPITTEDGRVQFRYDFVEIVSDFSAITGQGRVVRLEKYAGYKTLWVPKGEAFPLTVKYDLHKLSHRVPALLVTEDNIPGVPAGCLELDPASTPADSIEA